MPTWAQDSFILEASGPASVLKQNESMLRVKTDHSLKGSRLDLVWGARDAAAFCVAGAAQTHIYRRFAWQAWHKLTSTVVLRGRCGTDGTGWRAWTWFGRA